MCTRHLHQGRHNDSHRSVRGRFYRNDKWWLGRASTSCITSNASRSPLNLPPPNVTGHDGEDPVAQKKVDNGDGDWAFVIEILGWIIDGENFTIQLPPAKCDKIGKLMKTVCKSKSCHLKKFQVLAGKLQHASYGIPGGAGLFSPIDQAAIKVKNVGCVTAFGP